MYLDETDVIMCGENHGKNFGKKSSSIGQIWWYRDGLGMHGSIRSGNSSFYRGHHEQTRLCKHSSKTSKSQYWKLGIQEHCALYHDNDPKYSSRVVRHGYLYNCPKVIKTPPQSQDLNVTENLWFKLETEIRNYSISNKEDPKKALRE